MLKFRVKRVCVCLYICIWFQNHCLWAETYLENRMYKIPLCSSPSVDKPHFQAASQFELLRGKMSNFPSRHSSCILKGYDRFGRLWAYICKLFPQLCISAIGNKKTNVSLTWKPYCVLAVFPLQACLPAGSLLFCLQGSTSMPPVVLWTVLAMWGCQQFLLLAFSNSW